MKPVAAFLLAMIFVLAFAASAQETAYQSRTLEIALGNGFITQAELTYPIDGESPFPTVILLHGSGPYNMDATVMSFTGETLSANFRLLAETLPEQGIAVLRFNKRGMGAEGEIDVQQVQASTLDQLTADANAVIDAALEQPKVGDIYLYGWSEGGIVAANAASHPEVAGVILQAAPNGSVGSILPYQHLEIGIPYLTDVIDTDGDGQLTLDELMTIPMGPVALMPSFYIWAFNSTPQNPVFNPMTDVNGDEQIDIEAELRPAVENLIEIYPSFLPQTDAVWEAGELVAALEKPVLILHGDMDGWVPVTMAEEIATAAPEMVTLYRYEGLGHALSPTDVLAEDSLGVMDEQPIADAVDWILMQGS